jgi:C1A family cysteine protease
MIKQYGWKPQLPDFRDMKMGLERAKKPATLPRYVDLRPLMPAIYDQGNLSSCTACVLSAAVEYQLRMQKYKWIFTPSRLFIYFNEREIEGTVPVDAGANLRDGIKSINELGVCPENQLKDFWNWPYNITHFDSEPPLDCYKDALLHKSLKYESVPPILDFLLPVLAEKLPIACGIVVYTSFESDYACTTGYVPMPSYTETLLGGHAILLVGYDMDKSMFIFRNSWGITYGQQGYGFIPFSYITNPGLVADFWAITLLGQ